jgi:hypothetical protein
MLAGKPSWIAVSGWGIGLAALVVGRFRRTGNWTLASAAIGLAALVAAYAVVPGGAASLVRNVLTTSLLLAIGATVFVLSVGRYVIKPSRRSLRSATSCVVERGQVTPSQPEGCDGPGLLARTAERAR